MSTIKSPLYIYVVSWENQGCFKISESPKKTYFGLAFIYLGIHFPNSAISENVNNDLEGLLQNYFKANKNIGQCATDTVSVSVSADILVLVSLSVSADTDFYIGS